MKHQSNDLIRNYEKSIMLIVLSCVQELEIKVGKTKLVSISPLEMKVINNKGTV